MSTATDTRLCQTMLYSEARVCDEPASGTVRTLSGEMAVCPLHAEGLRVRWGLKLPPFAAAETQES